MEVEGDVRGLDAESGGHRFQRVPPTERRGRVHTSTVTVAVLDPETIESGLASNDDDFRVEWFSGSGAGGQHRNKHQNSVRLIHDATGIVVSIQGRDRVTNLTNAKKEMADRLAALTSKARFEAFSKARSVRGSGERGDKVRTIRFQADEAVDHRNGKRIKATDYMKGRMNELW